MTDTHRHRVSSGSPFEGKLGICRAIRTGNHVAVSGTAPIAPDGSNVAPGDAAAQARRCLEIVREALRGLGAELRHVHRTRTLLTRIEDWQAVGKVHAEFFGHAPPANTVMQVTRFIDPDWLVELETDAIIDD